MENKQAIKAIYSELQGYLAQAPTENTAYNYYEPWLWNQYNGSIQELNELTANSYDKFKLVPKNNEGDLSVTIDEYRQKLGGLIARLHGEYFSDEQVPFAEMPSTIISQSQNQNQSLQVQLVLEVSDLIHEKLNKAKEGSKEKTFLEKVKGSLSSVRNVSQLVTLLLTTAKKFGISIEELSDLF